MGKVLYVANLHEQVTVEELQTLFAAQGEVTRVEITWVERIGESAAIVEMASEKQATRALNALNGTELGGKRLFISYLVPDIDRDVTPRQRKTIDDIVAVLEEEEKVPVRQIEAIVRVCGGQFAQAILDEALTLEQQEGIMTLDGARRRSKGGVFFYLARYRMSPDARKIVYNRKGKLPAEPHG